MLVPYQILLILPLLRQSPSQVSTRVLYRFSVLSIVSPQLPLTLLRLRFGKTLSSYDFAKKFNAKDVLIVTNRPAIANSWFDDFDKFIDGYLFYFDRGFIERA
jgi:type II restriction endonuclease, putative